MQNITANNNQFSDSFFAVNLSGSNWQVSVPLMVATNIISITAEDALGNTKTESVNIERTALAPNASLSIAQPISGSVTQNQTISVSGQVTSDKAANSIHVTVNGQAATLSTTADVTVQNYRLDNVLLEEGNNTLTVRAAVDYELFEDEIIEQAANVIYQPESVVVPEPDLSLLAPTTNAYLSNRSFYLTLNYASHSGNANVSVNGIDVTLANEQYGTHSELLNFPQGLNEWQVDAVITDGIGQQSNATAIYYFDDEKPVITLDNNIQKVSVENIVTEQPYTISGTVSDAQLSSFTINGQNIDLEPLDNNSYRFTASIGLSIDESVNVEIQASDYSGNTQNEAYLLKLDSTVSLSMLLPAENTKLLNMGTPINLQVAARIEGIYTGYTARGRLLKDNNSVLEFSLNMGEGLVSGYANSVLDAGDYTVEVELMDGGFALTKTSRSFTVEDVANVPLTLNKVEPKNAAEYIETNSSITAYFNKTIDLSKLSFVVKETAHGFSYINSDPAGTEGFQAKGYQLVKVDIDDKPINGGLSILPGSSVVVFYPEREFAYDSQIDVTIIYDGEEYSRSRFRTRELPTFVEGVVMDQFAQPVAGINVEIVELGRLATTDAGGAFTFGYGDMPGKTLPNGRYTLHVNKGLKEIRFGSLLKKFFINKGERTSISTQTLPVLNTDDSFSQLSAGQEIILARGDLKLDLTASNSEVFFPDGRTAGFAMAIFMPLGTFPHNYDPMFMPYWMFNIHPMGIEVSGDMAIDFALPQMKEAGGHLWLDGAKMLLMGLDPKTDIIVPVGVGVVENHRVKSLRAEYSRLDAIGYAPMPEQTFEAMTAYANGETNLDAMISDIRDILLNPPAPAEGQ